MYPHTYYKVLMPNYRELAGNGRVRWHAVSFAEVGLAESMADAKAKYPWLRNPILEPVGFTPRELRTPPLIVTELETAEPA